RFGLPRAPALAHRLDRDTTGCLVLGRHRKALAMLARLFKAGRIRKTYWAVVEGGPPEGEGRIEMPLARRDETRGWWMKPDPCGQPAGTRGRVMGRGGPPLKGRVAERIEGGGGDITWLAIEPLTGRTHQLRVHCTAMGWPIVGDAIYGKASRSGGPILHLPAREGGVPISKNREPGRVTAPVPAHMHARLEARGWSPEQGGPVADAGASAPCS